jgi:hypothetical protein
MDRIGQGQTIMFAFDPMAPLEPVPVGQVADRIARFLKENAEEVSTIRLFEARNRDPLRTFWAQSPSDALEVKKLIEKATAEDAD